MSQKNYDVVVCHKACGPFYRAGVRIKRDKNKRDTEHPDWKIIKTGGNITEISWWDEDGKKHHFEGEGFSCCLIPRNKKLL